MGEKNKKAFFRKQGGCLFCRQLWSRGGVGYRSLPPASGPGGVSCQITWGSSGHLRPPARNSSDDAPFTQTPLSVVFFGTLLNKLILDDTLVFLRGIIFFTLVRKNIFEREILKEFMNLGSALGGVVKYASPTLPDRTHPGACFPCVPPPRDRAD